ncbi:hypothetical protein BGAL_0739g00020 [Botrytis galanthina]|uniref:Uncharacterized protein n=1 Tax=Botrytis galanthina TaxID=278940 RepID=A0A4S8QLZ2_9HELO|nr:hypothetical protein BGAL_0739g00020 [Botrytis galanthina]
MASIGKLIFTPANGTVETTFALANFNFDFSLFKIAAPKEFEGVGSALSSNRRENAESGRAHVTARKLAALFDSLLPATPALIQAYGQRTSEISQSLISESDTEREGLFAGQAGADGTTIWAAATSGQSAIKLEEWDASARSWLRTADRVKKLQQTQFEVITKSIGIPVNTKPQVYDSVMQAWTTALSGAENLIKGMPQRTQSGEILLGLSAWHIYPDLLILDASNTIVKQHDALVHDGGILTSGLQLSSTAHDLGVYWSLPLAHLRYYGDPIISSRSIAVDGTRLTIDELFQAVLGSVISSMTGDGLYKVEEIIEYAEWLKNLSEKVLEAFVANPERDFPIASFGSTWLCKLSHAAQRFLNSAGPDRQRYLQLIGLGSRRATEILPKTCQPHFGLSTYQRYLRLIKNPEMKIEVLRVLASHLGLQSNEPFIRYRQNCQKCHCSVFEYATAIPQIRLSAERTRDGEEKEVHQHVRWIHKHKPHSAGSYPFEGGHGYNETQWDDPSIDPHFASEEEEWVPPTVDDVCEAFVSRKIALAQAREEVHPLEGQSLKCYESSGGLYVRWQVTPSETLPSVSTASTDTQNAYMNSESMVELSPRYDLLVGHSDDAALFILGRDSTRIQKATQNIPQYANRCEMGQLFGADNVCLSTLLAEFSESLREVDGKYLESLIAIASVANIYKLLPHATVSVRLLEQKLSESRWLPKVLPVQFAPTVNLSLVFENSARKLLDCLKPYELTRMEAFAAICMLESGEINLEPKHFSNVMALSTGDSIYVAAALLCDPSETPLSHEIRRIVGNVGRPGIALLIPCSDPKIKRSELNSWNLINNGDFNGELQDSFQDTSLHLSFTGFSLPIDTGVVGGQDSEVILLESVVSLHERETRNIV